MTTQKRIATALATALAITAAIIGVALATSTDTDDWTRGYEPCATEDAAGPCYWDATEQGNGEGRSFLVEPTADGEGQVIYVNDAGIPLPTSIDVGK